MIAQGNPMPVPYGEMRLAPAVYPRTSAPVMKAGRKGRGYRAAGVKRIKKSRSDRGQELRESYED
ncbi:Uncharacterised protein [Shigella sonnei]|nr:Uncharacterised protein [Shigella sonnei]